jgi:uncharacterized SAM-binding protein YcdF (DUF218 family)
MRRRIYILGIVILILLLAVGSCRKAGTWLVKTDEVEQADVMVILMGSFSERVLQAADLYEQGVSDQVFIPEEAMGAYKILEARGVQLISNSTQARNALVSMGVPSENIVILPGDATSSLEEARIIRDYLNTVPGIESVLLVTSTSHTRRAGMIFRAALNALDNPPAVHCSPNPYTSYHAERWWKDRNDIQRVVGEYMKMTDFVLFERRKLRKADLGQD